MNMVVLPLPVFLETYVKQHYQGVLYTQIIADWGLNNLFINTVYCIDMMHLDEYMSDYINAIIASLDMFNGPNNDEDELENTYLLIDEFLYDLRCLGIMWLRQYVSVSSFSQYRFHGLLGSTHVLVEGVNI